MGVLFCFGGTPGLEELLDEGSHQALDSSDSVTILTMVLCLKPSRSPGLGLLARELALYLAEGVYLPDIAAVHIGGVTNKLADWLSREAAPGGTDDRPAVLQQSSETVIVSRTRSWYRTLKPLSPVRKSGLSEYMCL